MGPPFQGSRAVPTAPVLTLGPVQLEGGPHPVLPFPKVGDPHAPAEPGPKVPLSAQFSSLSRAILIGPCTTAWTPFPLSQREWMSQDTRSCSGGPMHFAQVHVVPGLAKPLTSPLLCRGAGRSARLHRGSGVVSRWCKLPSGAGGDSHGGGVTASSPLGLQLPSHLAGSVLGACSECRKGGAGLLGGAKRCEAYRQHPPPHPPGRGKRPQITSRPRGGSSG